jgi:hypothetical protein
MAAASCSGRILTDERDERECKQWKRELRNLYMRTSVILLRVLKPLPWSGTGDLTDAESARQSLIDKAVDFMENEYGELQLAERMNIPSNAEEQMQQLKATIGTLELLVDKLGAGEFNWVVSVAHCELRV